MNGADNEPMTVQQAADCFGAGAWQVYMALAALVRTYIEAMGPVLCILDSTEAPAPRLETWRRVGKKGCKQEHYF